MENPTQLCPDTVGKDFDLRPLADEVLLARLDALVAEERERTADVVAHIAEVDRRELPLDLAYESTFDFCMKRLRYSEAGAYLRIRAARAFREFPRVLADLRSGAVTLDGIARLAPHLTLENNDAVLTRAAGAKKTEVLALVAELGGGTDPRPDRVLPLKMSPSPPACSEVPQTPILPPPRRVRFEFEADDELVMMVRQLKDLLAHRNPSGRLELIFKESARCLLERLRLKPAKRRPAVSNKPKAKRRWIPEAVKRLVRERDGGRCTYVTEDGRRCESTHALQYDHVIPWAAGGPSDDPANIRLLCRPHNLRLARRRFGPRGGEAAGPPTGGRSP